MIANDQEHYCKAPLRCNFANARAMSSLHEDTELIRALVQWANDTPTAIAKRAGLTPTTVLRPYKGEATTRLSLPTLEKLRAAFPGFPWAQPTADLPDRDPLQDYVEVELLPTFAGLGGGGTGDGLRQTTLLPRRLVENELGLRAEDILVVDCEGDSMVPLFFDGDRVAVNRRKTSLAAPGVFALWDGDGFVLKNVERDTHAGTIRVFSENKKYKEREYRVDEIDMLQIMGRPVWFARRL